MAIRRVRGKLIAEMSLAQIQAMLLREPDTLSPRLRQALQAELERRHRLGKYRAKVDPQFGRSNF